MHIVWNENLNFHANKKTIESFIAETLENYQYIRIFFYWYCEKRKLTPQQIHRLCG